MAWYHLFFPPKCIESTPPSPIMISPCGAFKDPLFLMPLFQRLVLFSSSPESQQVLTGPGGLDV